MLISRAISIALASALVAGCGGGSGDSPIGTSPPASSPPEGCTGSCVSSDSLLSSADVQQVLAQAIGEARARNAPATIAVTDRVGNVLAVYRMAGAPATVRIDGDRGVQGGLEGLAVVPAEQAAIAKAITGSYLSSEGNAFSTRTASQIVQEHFNPGEENQPGGPLFGVQFSQLACSDLIQRGDELGPGPRRTPLGLSADAGGFPLYKSGTPVGGIGVAADGIYGLDRDIQGRDQDLDELIALAGTFNYAAPLDRRGDQITVDGKTFRFSDAVFGDLSSQPGSATFASLPANTGALVPVRGYFDGTLRAGLVFGSPASGIRPDQVDYTGLDAFVLVDENNNERYRPQAGTDGAGAISANEARTVVSEALKIANRARAQIRKPLSTPARVSISVVDTNGVVLALARTRDAPIFGIDVSLQKARTAAFFSGDYAYADVASVPDAVYPNADASAGPSVAPISYLDATRTVVGRNSFFGDGAFAFTPRAIGNLARPFLPDGLLNAPNGPLSKPFPSWSPFTVGLQLDLALNRIAGHVLFVAGAIEEDVPQNCTTLARLPNGIQIFPGGAPIYRSNQLVGAIGVSGDGIDQDDMISFLGVHNAGLALNGSIGNAPPERRSDRVTIPGGFSLRYVQCPQAPFLDSNEQNVCGGK